MRLLTCRESTLADIVALVKAVGGSSLLVACEHPVGPCPELTELPRGINKTTVSALAAPAVDAFLARLLEMEGIPVLLTRDPISGVPDGAELEIAINRSAIVEKETGRAIATVKLTAEYMIWLARRRGGK